MLLSTVLLSIASSLLYVIAGALVESCSLSSASSNPFRLDLADLDRSYGGTLYYIGGSSYTLTLSGSGGEQFRGFLVQARAAADDSPVGIFTDDNGGHQMSSSCTSSEPEGTDSSVDLQSVVSLNWTAPSQDSGSLYFLFAVVGESDGSSVPFWATAVTDKLFPCGPPLYLHQGHCIEQCPSQHYGDSESGQCLTFPSDYDLIFNASQYSANLNSETPINSAAFYMQLSINLTSVSLSEIASLNFRLSQTQLVQSLFDFQSGTGDNVYEAVQHIVSIDSDTAIVTATIILVARPPDVDYPIEIDMNIRALLLSSAGDTVTATSLARGTIMRVPGACNFVTCQNGGTCEDTNSTHFTCQCPQGYTGETCGELIDMCQTLEPCVNGVCTSIAGLSYNCTCYPGFTGQSCSEHVCEDIECSNRGICVSFGWDVTCRCDAGYTGTDCETEMSNYHEEFCTGVNASVGVLQCECRPGWTGHLCETELVNCSVNHCENGGSCFKAGNKTHCACLPEWTGTYCETRLSTTSGCNENPCFNNATCIDGCSTDGECPSGAFQCKCPPGFMGDMCYEDDPAINFCQPSSCSNSGTCTEDYGSQISCQCTKEFTGTTCDQLVISSSPESCSTTSTTALSESILLAIICSVTVVVITGMIGCPIIVVLTLRYRSKTQKVTQTTSTNNLRRRLLSESSSVFSNTDVVDNGIYFEVGPPTTSSVASSATTGHPYRSPTSSLLPSPPASERSGSFTFFSNPSSQSTPHPPLHPLTTRRTASTSSQFWTGNPLSGRACSFMSQSTMVSDYEQPVQRVHRSLLSTHDRPSGTRGTRKTLGRSLETVC